MAQYGLLESQLSSLIFLHGGRAYRKSSGALRIVWMLDSPGPLFYVFIRVPGVLRDVIYNFIGNHRYRWFGKSESCRVPGEVDKSRFINRE